MKKIIQLLKIITIVIATIISGCKKESETITGNTNCPDNNSKDCATKIQLGQTVNEKIETTGDVDFFEFTTQQDGVIEVRITSVPDNININSFLYRSTNTSSSVISSTSTGNGVNVFFIKGQKSGTFFLKVYDRDNNSRSDNQYTLLVNNDVSDSYELNENTADAKSIPLDSYLHAKIKPADDLDEFQFTMPQDGVIDFSIENVPSNINIWAGLYNSDGVSSTNRIIISENNSLGGSVTLSAVRKQGLHYILIYDQNEDNYSENYYNFKINLDVADVNEYNGSRADAKPVNLNTFYYAKLRPNNDEDYFQFTTSSTGNITVNVSNVPIEIDADVYILNSSGSTIASSTNTALGQSVTLIKNNAGAGTYYLKIEDGGNNASSTQFYNFRINN